MFADKACKCNRKKGVDDGRCLSCGEVVSHALPEKVCPACVGTGITPWGQKCPMCEHFKETF